MNNNMNIYKNKTPDEILSLLELKTPPFDPFDIAYQIGVKVDNKTIEWNKMGYDGEIYVKNYIPRIWINPSMKLHRQNFTLAHELGHLVNDILPNIEQYNDSTLTDDYMSLKRDGSNNLMERIANRFAAELLMPIQPIIDTANEIIDAYEKSNNGQKIDMSMLIDRLAKKFRVSTRAMHYRLQNIGAI